MIDALGDTSPQPFTATSASTLGKNAKPATYLIDKILETNSHGILFGQSMAFKSFVALEMAACISEGKPFLGNTCYQQGKVVYVCGEGLGGLSRRIKAIQLEKDWNLSNLHILDRRVVIDSDTNMKAFKEALDEISPELIVFDTFSSLAINTDEQSNSQVAQALALVQRTCEGRSSLLVHHLGKNASQGMRGASAFLNNVDYAYELTRQDDITTMKCKKVKDGEATGDIVINSKVIDLGMVEQNGKNSTSLVMELGEEKLKNTLGKNEQIILDIIEENGEILNENNSQQLGHLGMSQMPLRTKANVTFSVKKTSFNKTFDRAIKNLLTANKLLKDNDCFYLQPEKVTSDKG